MDVLFQGGPDCWSSTRRLALIDCLDMGKPISELANIDVTAA